MTTSQGEKGSEHSILANRTIHYSKLCMLQYVLTKFVQKNVKALLQKNVKAILRLYIYTKPCMINRICMGSKTAMTTGEWSCLIAFA